MGVNENQRATPDRTNHWAAPVKRLEFQEPVWHRFELRGAWRYVVALLLAGTAVLLRYALDPWLGNYQQLITLYGTVAVAVWLGGWRAGLVTVICGFLLLNYFIFPPRGTFSVDSTAIASFVGAAFSCAFIIGFAEAGRRAWRVARQHAADADAQRQHHEEILDTFRDGFFVFDSGFRYIYANAAGLQMSRHSWEQLRGRFILELFPDLKPLIAEYWDPALKEQKPTVYEHFYPRFDSWFETRLFPTGDTMTVIVGDITARKRAEEARLRLAAIVESSTDAIISVDLEGRITSWNRGAQALYGYEAEEIMGDTLDRLLPKQATDEGSPILERIKRGETVAHYETMRLRRDGSEVAVALTVSPVRDPEGRVVGASKIARDITRRKQAEELLRQSEERLRLVTDNVPALISYIDRDLVYRFANAKYFEWFGRTPAKVIGTHSREVLGEPFFAQRVPYMQQALRGVQARFEATTQHHSLGPRHCEVVYIPDRDAAGEVRGFYVFVTDVHDRKVAEQALQEALQKLRAHFSNSPLAVVEWNEQFTVVQWSQGAEKLFGYSAAQAVGKSINDLPIVHPKDIPHVAKVGERLLSGEAFVLSHNRNIRPDAKVLYCEWYNTVVRGAGNSMSILSLVLDVTDRTQAEQALRESERHFRELASAMPQLVWSANADGTVDYYNDRVASYAAVQQMADGKWDWSPIVHADDLVATVKAWQMAVAEIRPYTITHRLAMADGTYRWHLSRATPVRDATGHVVKWFGTATDIDDQKRAEEKLEETVSQRTAKLRETVGELERFSYSIAHDMRAPLRSMAGFASLLRSEYSEKLDENGIEYLRRICVSAERMDRLIHDVLNYSNIVRGDLVLDSIDLGRLTEEITQSYPHLQEPKATVVLDKPLPAVRANAAALTQVISNLLGNAVKFVPPGVKPRVVIRAEKVDGDIVRIWFEDNGIGIPLNSQHRIFEMFQRLHKAEAYEGTGIGLSIVQKAAERMGGRVGVESEPGRGSRFWLELQRAG